MSRAKKPRNKAYRPKPENAPMMPDTRRDIARQLHGALFTLVERPSLSAATATARLLAILTAAIDYSTGVSLGRLQDRTDRAALAIKSSLLAQEAIEARHARLGAWSVSAAEAHSLRAATLVLDEELARVPWNVWQAAVSLIDNMVVPAEAA